MNYFGKENLFPNNFIKNRRLSRLENIKNLDNITKKNWPELKLTKNRPGSNPENITEPQNKISNKTGLKYPKFISNYSKNNSLFKKGEICFPTIKNTNNFNLHFGSEFERNMIITNYKKGFTRNENHSTKKNKLKTLYGNYASNRINKINYNTDKITNNINNLNDKTNYTEKMNNENKNLNTIVNLHKFKTNMNYPKNNKSMPSKVRGKVKKIKKIKNEPNVVNTLTIRPLIQTNNIYNTNNNIIKNNINNIVINNNINNTDINKNVSPTNNTKNNSIEEPKPTVQEPVKTTNNFTQYQEMIDRLNLLNNLFNSLSSLTASQNPFSPIYQSQKTVELNSAIFIVPL